jgi:sigma-E processing peptidase SpoIIGA
METTVYGDLLFLINGGMDCLCFLLTARLLHRRLSTPRLLIGSALGGVYAVVALLIEVGQVPALLIDIAVCLLLCVLVFPGEPGHRQSWLLAAGVYLLVSLLMGGAITGLYNLLNRLELGRWLNQAGADGPTAWLFTLLALGSGLLAAAGGRLFGARHTDPVTVEVTLHKRTVSLAGMVDSGNLLTDPVGGLPVVPVSREALRPLLSPALMAILEDSPPRLEALTKFPEARRIRLIPTTTATGQGLLVGVHGPKGDRVRQVDALVAPTDLTGQGRRENGQDSPQVLVPTSLT